ncbi:Protein SAWADEE HOMEODOMAIN-like 1, partial [Cucurbita argyrosperma subsp. sororia]
MERLRRRDRQMFSGFTKGEIEKMEKLLEESGLQLLNREFCQKVTQGFNRSSGRAGKPVIKWMEVYNWLQSRLQDFPKNEKRMSEIPEACPSNKTQESSQRPEGEKSPDLSELEFEARSSKDGAWYDVAMFLTHRFLRSGEAEARVRFVGFGAEEDEWVNIKQAVRVRSVPIEHSECQKLKVGDIVLCFQERRDQAIYYDAHIVEVQRRMHDIRGCRCLFLVRYEHDSTEEKVRLRRLCHRPAHRF